MAEADNLPPWDGPKPAFKGVGDIIEQFKALGRDFGWDFKPCARVNCGHPLRGHLNGNPNNNFKPCDRSGCPCFEFLHEATNK